MGHHGHFSFAGYYTNYWKSWEWKQTKDLKKKERKRSWKVQKSKASLNIGLWPITPSPSSPPPSHTSSSSVALKKVLWLRCAYSMLPRPKAWNTFLTPWVPSLSERPFNHKSSSSICSSVSPFSYRSFLYPAHWKRYSLKVLLLRNANERTFYWTYQQVIHGTWR